MVEYILCYGGPAEHWGPLPATRQASRKILIEQNIKKRTGPALWLLCGNIKSAPASLDRSSGRPALYVFSLLDHHIRLLLCTVRHGSAAVGDGTESRGKPIADHG